jgi:hypothetical protein
VEDNLSALPQHPLGHFPFGKQIFVIAGGKRCRRHSRDPPSNYAQNQDNRA